MKCCKEMCHSTFHITKQFLNVFLTEEVSDRNPRCANDSSGGGGGGQALVSNQQTESQKWKKKMIKSVVFVLKLNMYKTLFHHFSSVCVCVCVCVCVRVCDF